MHLYEKLMHVFLFYRDKYSLKIIIKYNFKFFKERFGKVYAKEIPIQIEDTK